MSAPSRIAQEQWIEQCQGLVRSLAVQIHRKLPATIELDDLIAYGELGLMEAAQSFDPSHGCQFSTFAYYRIRGSIYDGAAKMSWGLREDDSESVPHALVDLLQPGPSAAAMENEIRDKLHTLIDALPQSVAELIRATYFDGLTLEEAGHRLGLSKSWASPLRAQGLRTLARSLAGWQPG